MRSRDDKGRFGNEGVTDEQKKARARRKAKEWRESHPEQYRESLRRWYAANKESVAAYAKKNKHRIGLKRRYGITVEHYNDMFDEQMGGCAICGNTRVRKGNNRLHVDHDHKTGEVRGLLCFRCNSGLGMFSDNPALLDAALTYITKGRACADYRGGTVRVYR